MFGPNVQVYAATHPIEISPRRSGLEIAYPITVFPGEVELTSRLAMMSGWEET